MLRVDGSDLVDIEDAVRLWDIRGEAEVLVEVMKEMVVDSS